MCSHLGCPSEAKRHSSTCSERSQTHQTSIFLLPLLQRARVKFRSERILLTSGNYLLSLIFLRIVHPLKGPPRENGPSNPDCCVSIPVRAQPYSNLTNVLRFPTRHSTMTETDVQAPAVEETKPEGSEENAAATVSTTEAAIIRQLEYYFGDANLAKDKFMKDQIAKDEGWVPLDVLLTFKRLKSLSEDKKVIVDAFTEKVS